MKKLLDLNFYYYSNFPIKSNIINLNGGGFFKKTNNFFFKKKICKNFIIFLIFVNFLKLDFLKKKSNFLKIRFFVKPSKQNLFNYLRAPYKNKLARNQLYTPRYKLYLNISLFSEKLSFYKDPKIYIYLFIFFKKYLNSLETNVLYLNKVSLSHTSILKNYWNYNV